MAENNIANKVKKLLALATSNKNDFEAQQALNKAHYLMLEHNLEMNDIAEENEPIFLPLKKYTTRKYGVMETGILVASFFRCKLLVVKEKRGEYLMFAGYKNDVNTAREVFDFMTSYMFRKSMNEQQKRYDKGGSCKGWEESFIVGFLMQVEMFWVANISTKFSLVAFTPEEVEDAVKEFSQKSFSQRSTRLNFDAFTQGTYEGENFANKKYL
jgi:hypothetical protein